MFCIRLVNSMNFLLPSFDHFFKLSSFGISFVILQPCVLKRWVRHRFKLRYFRYCAFTSNNIIDMKVFLVSSIYFVWPWNLSFLGFNCSLIAPFSKKNDWNNPKIGLMKCKTWVSKWSLLRIQWNCDKSLPLFRIWDCKNAISISDDSQIGLNLFLKRMSQILLSNSSPACERTFKDILELLAFTDPSCTIWSFVLPAFSRMTERCGK